MWSLEQATGSPNTAMGFSAGYYTVATSDNTAIGYQAMQGTSANPLTGNGYNTAVGHGALSLIKGAATDNTALGMWALESNTTGSYNTSLGFAALIDDTTGTDSTSVGFQALNQATDSVLNTAVGYNAGEYVTSGTDNIAIGYQAMKGTSANPLTGTSAANLGGNIAIGDNALTAITGNADGNVAIGYDALTKSTVNSTKTAGPGGPCDPRRPEHPGEYQSNAVLGRAVAGCYGQRRTQGTDPAGKQTELSRSLRRHRRAG